MASDKYRRRLKKGERLFREGDPGDCAYIVEKGMLEVFAGKGRRRRLLALLGPGEVVGEMAIIDRMPRSATALAQQPTELRVITPANLRGKLDTADPLVRVLLRLILKRYRSVLRPRGARRKPREKERATALRRLRLVQELEQSLDEDRFVLHFQPIIALADGSIAGFEALVRWKRRTGLVPPGEFIPMMEESDLIRRLDEWVLGAACGALQRLAGGNGASAARPLFMSVNLSGRDFGIRGWSRSIRRALAAARIPPQRLRLEITESTLVENFDRAVAEIRRCRKLGAQVAVDDFGTGYSSLSYLRNFSVDSLKIDKSFVQAMHAGRNGPVILGAIRAMAHALDMTVVAEGVETAEQAAALRELRFDYAQGYLFGRPLPEDDAARRLADRAPPPGPAAPPRPDVRGLAAS